LKKLKMKRKILAIECRETKDLKHGTIFEINPDSPGIEQPWNRHLCAQNSFMAVPFNRSKEWDKKIAKLNRENGF